MERGCRELQAHPTRPAVRLLQRQRLPSRQANFARPHLVPATTNLSIAGHNAALVVDDHVAVVQVVRVGPLFLEASQREPQAQRSRQLSVPLHQRAVQRLRYRQRLQRQRRGVHVVTGAGLVASQQPAASKLS